MATQTLKSGLVPISTPVVYKQNYKISDDNVGTFLSLKGARKFFNPGLGLTLQTPNTGNNTIEKHFTVSTTVSKSITTVISGKPDSAGFLLFDTTAVIQDDILGTQKNNLQVYDYATNNLVNIGNLVVPNGLGLVFSCQIAATYTISFNANGNVTGVANNSNFHADMIFYMKINGQEFPMISGLQKFASGSNTLSMDFSIPIFTKVVSLNVGDTVQIFGRYITYLTGGGNKTTCTFRVDNIYFDIMNSATVTPPSNFSNPLNIADFNISSINYYGANRDTLILVGNKLTS